MTYVRVATFKQWLLETKCEYGKTYVISADDPDVSFMSCGHWYVFKRKHRAYHIYADNPEELVRKLEAMWPEEPMAHCAVTKSGDVYPGKPISAADRKEILLRLCVK